MSFLAPRGVEAGCGRAWRGEAWRGAARQWQGPYPRHNFFARGLAWQGRHAARVGQAAVGRGLARPGDARRGNGKGRIHGKLFGLSDRQTARLCLARHRGARQCVAWHGDRWRGDARRGPARHGLAGHGLARQGKGRIYGKHFRAWLGVTSNEQRSGMGWLGATRPRKARPGSAGRGAARRGKARAVSTAHETNTQRERRHRMALETLTVTLTGCRPLILHNGQLADPRNEHTRGIKPIAKKRDKTEDDYAELQRLEWLGGLYRDAAGRISVTEDMILMCMIEGARKTKKGKQATAGVLGASPFFPIEYDGPSDPIELFETGAFCDYRGVVVSMSRTMRARPRFDRWSVLVELLVDTTVINADEVIAALEVAGRVIGLGDYRPRYGRFTVDA